MRYFFVSYKERSGEYEFVTNNVVASKSKHIDLTVVKMIRNNYGIENTEIDNGKIIVNNWDICISYIDIRHITKEEYDVLSKYIHHL